MMCAACQQQAGVNAAAAQHGSGFDACQHCVVPCYAVLCHAVPWRVRVASSKQELMLLLHKMAVGLMNEVLRDCCAMSCCAVLCTVCRLLAASRS
jgi:hypothetical protein